MRDLFIKFAKEFRDKEWEFICAFDIVMVFISTILLLFAIFGAIIAIKEGNYGRKAEIATCAKIGCDCSQVDVRRRP